MREMSGEVPIETLLGTYPRTRPELPASHRRIYIEHYRANRSGERGLSHVTQKLESWMHRRVAAGVGGSVLEIGAGNLNHLRYHPDVKTYDVIEPFRELWENQPQLHRVRRVYSSIEEVPAGERYDAILSVAVLEHLTDLPWLVARAGLLASGDRCFRAGFPSEGGLLWGLAWRSTTGLAFRRKYGLSYAALMRHEHVNTAGEILRILDHFYERVEVERFPLPFTHGSFYTAAAAGRPRSERCQEFCAQRARVGTGTS